MSEKYNTLILEADVERRNRLKQAAMAVQLFSNLDTYDAPEHAMKVLTAGESEINVVFVSHKLPEDDLAAFVKQAKESEQGKDAAYVLVIPSTDDMQSVIAKNVLHGLDGFLAEPYSVDALVGITQLSARVKSERSAMREIKAIQLLMTQVSEQVNRIAQLKQHGVSTMRDMRKLHDMCKVFDDLDQETRDRYMSLAVDIFETAPLPPPVMKKMYKGVSSRVQKRMEEKMKKKLEAEAAAADS